VCTLAAIDIDPRGIDMDGVSRVVTHNRVFSKACPARMGKRLAIYVGNTYVDETIGIGPGRRWLRDPFVLPPRTGRRT
jgi:hypothetical protein